MSVLKALRQRVAPELNFLLTDDPAEREGALDCGWRPHLHAYHAFLVARMFGAAAELRTGDIAVISGALPPITRSTASRSTPGARSGASRRWILQ